MLLYHCNVIYIGYQPLTWGWPVAVFSVLFVTGCMYAERRGVMWCVRWFLATVMQCCASLIRAMFASASLLSSGCLMTHSSNSVQTCTESCLTSSAALARSRIRGRMSMHTVESCCRLATHTHKKNHLWTELSWFNDLTKVIATHAFQCCVPKEPNTFSLVSCSAMVKIYECRFLSEYLHMHQPVTAQQRFMHEHVICQCVLFDALCRGNGQNSGCMYV